MAANRRAIGFLVATVFALLLSFVWFGAALEAKTYDAEDSATADAATADATAVDATAVAEDITAARSAAAESASTVEDTTVVTDGTTVTFAAANDTTGDETTGGDTTGGDTTRGDTTTADRAGCVRPREVTTFSGAENQRTASFRITGETFRLGFETEPVGRDPLLPAVEVDVLDEDGRSIGEGFTAFDGEDGDVNILAGPGTFRLEIRAEQARYTIKVDDCLGENGRNDDDGRVDDLREVQNDVIARSIPDKRLPNTGGPSFLLLAVAMLLTGASVGALLSRRC
jgi:hypothetical protein